MPKTYLALTIGPIYKTLMSTKKAHEIWGASYLFSWIMENIIYQIDTEKYELIVPVKAQIKERKGAGLFPDRLMLSTEMGNIQEAISYGENAVNDLAKEVTHTLGKSVEYTNVYTFLQEYLHLYWVETQDLATIKDENNQNPLVALNELLDVAELQIQFPKGQEGENYLLSFLARVQTYECLWAQKAFDTSIKKQEFATVDEISAVALYNASKTFHDIWADIGWLKMKKELGNKDTIIERLKTKEAFLTCHKYYAIVQSDGDDIGKTIGTLHQLENGYADFSRALHEFGEEAVKRIYKYIGGDFKGVPLYAGGDDLMFFAPLVNGKGASLFSLIQEIENVFDEKMQAIVKRAKEKYESMPKKDKDDEDKFKEPKLSFGVSIVYYKYPMQESLATAKRLLFDVAKKYEWNGQKKNCLALQVQKHSGQLFSLEMNKATELYEKLKMLIQNYVTNNGELPNKFLNSITYTLNRNEALLKQISGNKTRIEAFMEHNFNEDVHKGIEPYKKEVVALIRACFQDTAKPLENLYAMLRMINFLTAKDNSNEDEY
ncbi:MAG: type III-B CRISPR-associated protein Cas10/Cmr2 [Bacteroidia bacterium]